MGRVTGDKIIAAIETCREPVITSSEIGDRLGVTRQAINYHMPRLVDSGVVQAKKAGTATVYWVEDNEQKEHPDLDGSIIDVLRDGRATGEALVDWTEANRCAVYNRLEVLQTAGFIDIVHDGTRLFELVNDPRDVED